MILAFVAQKVISGGDDTEAPPYNDLVNAKSGLIVEGKIEEVDVNPKDNTIDVKRTNGENFSTGYPPDGEEGLVTLLEKNNV
ncbi:MAG TPA: ATP-dependent metallopeptidase FtsH/Yme1/Tma family protein, partial [Solirubrobacterales bacterium]|nr:ATP-dependent metallopeptidase FtsH/Yme1/Tma family protein [Solirubrobacterales bacterium]